jgi:hypothetical protein
MLRSGNYTGRVHQVCGTDTVVRRRKINTDDRQCQVHVRRRRQKQHVNGVAVVGYCLRIGNTITIIILIICVCLE